MNIPFYKMHGAANDFIVVDDRSETFPLADRDWLARVMARNTGVGSEGILLIQPSDRADFRMRFFNPDGGEVDMCGNGARCIARLAHELGAAPASMRFETQAGDVGAEIDRDQVRLTMTPPTDWQMDESLTYEGNIIRYHYVNSGVPHVVIETDNVAAVDLAALGSAVRYHTQFAPDGTNVNVIEITGANSLRLRTYERGVEAETPACGTGIVAAALLAAKAGRVAPPVHVTTAGGDELAVAFTLTNDGAANVTLTGPATHVFQGTIEYNDSDS